METVAIAGRAIGPNEPVYIVAEVGAAHGGSMARALKLVYEAHRAGADAVKFQTYRPQDMVARDSLAMLTDGPWQGSRLWDLYALGQTPFDWHERLFAYARELGITPFSTPFSLDGLALLESLNCPAYKIASAENAYEPLKAALLKTGKPVLMSLGLNGTPVVGTVPLHCVSAYPCRVEDADLGQIGPLRPLWNKVYGLSDHSPGWQVPVMAVALGVSVIEKHLQLDLFDGNLDACFALEPSEFREMVERVRAAEAAMDTPAGDPERASRQFKRQLVHGEWVRAPA